jgi:hypothetical protein
MCVYKNNTYSSQVVQLQVLLQVFQKSEGWQSEYLCDFVRVHFLRLSIKSGTIPNLNLLYNENFKLYSPKGNI